MSHIEQLDTAVAPVPARREWHAPDLRELPADATALNPGVLFDGPGSS